MTARPRRRIYLMRHAQVRYFQGRHPHEVLLTEHGRQQAETAAESLSGVVFDRVITSGLVRTLETARIVAPDHEPEHNRELREIESGDIRGLEPAIVQEMMTAAFRGVRSARHKVPRRRIRRRMLDRVLPQLDALLADESWDIVLLVLHGAVNRAILSRAATGQRTFLGGFEQAPGCINVLDVDAEGAFVVRAVNHTPYDPAHVARAATDDDGAALAGVPRLARRGIRRVPAQPGMGLLSLQNASLRFGGIVALDEVSFEVEEGDDLRTDRPERRRQDDGVQRDHAALPSRLGRHRLRRQSLLRTPPSRVVGSGSRERSRTSRSSRR